MALKKLNDAWTGKSPPVLTSRTRSDGGAIATDSHETAVSCVLASDGELGNETLTHETAAYLSAVKASPIKPGDHGYDFLPEPEGRHQAMLSPEREQLEPAEKTEMDSLISKGIWTQFPHLAGEVVLGIKRLYSRKIGEHSEQVKHKCRFVAKDFRKIKGIHYEESSSSTTAGASIRMALATTAVRDMKLRHIDFEQAFILADIDSEIYIELPEEYRELPDAAGGLNKAIYRWCNQGGWNTRLIELSPAVPCVFRKLAPGKLTS